MGSGKSEVRRILQGCGIRTIDADAVGHEILAGPGFEAVAERWPDVVEDGTVNRKSLAGKVFGDMAALAELESVTHALIFGKIEADLEGFDGVAVVEVPLVRVFQEWPRIVVDATDATRFHRAIERGKDPADISRRMASQPTRSEWLASADLVIPNHGSLADLAAAVDRVHAHLQHWASSPGEEGRRPGDT